MTKLCLHDALLATKVSQAHSANAHRAADPEFKVNEHVYPSTAHRRHEHLNGDSKRVAKFMPRFDGPYKIVSDHLPTLLNCQHTLTYTATFHASERNIPNNATLFPSRELPTPAPVHNDAASSIGAHAAADINILYAGANIDLKLTSGYPVMRSKIQTR